jgi:hypothetical protein
MLFLPSALIAASSVFIRTVSDCQTLPLHHREDCQRAVALGVPYEASIDSTQREAIPEAGGAEPTPAIVAALFAYGVDVGMRPKFFAGFLLGPELHYRESRFLAAVDLGFGSSQDSSNVQRYYTDVAGNCHDRQKGNQFTKKTNCEGSSNAEFLPAALVEYRYQFADQFEAGGGFQLSNRPGPFITADWTGGWAHLGLRAWSNAWELCLFFTGLPDWNLQYPSAAGSTYSRRRRK